MTAKQRSFDSPLFYLTLCLFVAGIIILASSSMPMSYKDSGFLLSYVGHQLLNGSVAGLGAFFLFQYIPYRFWKKAALPLMILSFILLALVFIPELSYSYGGARRWLKIGSISIQPSEILKISFIMYLSSWLDSRRKDVASISYGMIPFAFMVVIIGIFLMMQPDMGTLGVITATACIIYFLGGGRVTQLGMLGVFGLAAGYVLVHVAPYRLARILVFINPSLDPQGAGYQINQALIAIGSGGFFGMGLGRSLQKYYYLPEPMGDSIFAIFAEEAGFLGVVILLALFGLFLWRGFVIARSCPDAFGQLLAGGLAAGIAVQAFINMAAISGLLPLTGISLPFVSYGGTSLAVSLASAGILVNISKYR